ncbi:tRNA selenocysteine 1-associated protein 1 [Condylostylus longicornis]|uniref:tRNA selenocysteine 1-associated protein 1 n=1 Tax=Condylostylus longicornis TaxID=2530218 RepID=UPI00244DCBBA|nr:tRNA selenocysteine 1-associated protein 1 [Condylostylus longicornis]
MANVHCQLWMGSLETYMTENFIIAAFRKMGEEPQNVRLMRNKYTGEPSGYCFVNFSSDDKAIDAMHKLNGKPIPGTNPIVRFRLNSASNSYKLPGNEREFSVWVGDLSSDVDDYSLYKVFSSKYSSIKTAKVILDSSGFSKGYGFVRFGIEDEQQAALYDMNGYIGLGSKPLKICNAVPKPKTLTGTDTTTTVTPSYMSGYSGNSAATTTTTQSADYSQYYDPSVYWQGYSAWQGYYDQQNGATDPTAYYQQQQAAAMQQHTQQTVAQQAEAWSAQHNQNYVDHHNQPDEDMQLIDHKVIINVDKMNREMAERDRNLWDALESSKWLPIEQLEVF